MTRKKECNSKSNSFVAAAEQVYLQPVLEHRQRRATDMERQAPDTRHQAPYIPDTCFVCVIVRCRHLDLTIS